MFNSVVNLLAPHCETESARRMLVQWAFNDNTLLLNSVDYSGSSQEFATNLVVMLQRHGQLEPGVQALWRLLTALKNFVGHDGQTEIDAFKDYANTPQPRLHTVSDDTQPLIFISYSRANREYAETLRDDLRKANFRVWRDVHDIPAGSADWWADIQEAIDHCDTMILCLSLPALKSPLFSDECRYARQQGKRVIPVVADEMFDNQEVLSGAFSLPNWMKRVQRMDFREGVPQREAIWKNLLQTLRTPYLLQPVPFPTKSTELPPNYVKRADEFEPLVKALVNESNDAVAIVAALKGAGGFGKTTLAKALCRDLRVNGAFDDGILWITLGESLLEAGSGLENELISRLRDAIYVLSGKSSPVTTLSAAQDAFAQAIGDKYVLVVVDDVWAGRHANPFIVKGKHNATLLTTRYEDTMPRDTRAIRVDRMDQDDAYRLLTAGIPNNVLPGDTSEIEKLVKRLGRWALLLSLVNDMLTERITIYRETAGIALSYANKLLDDEGLTAFDAEDAQDRQRAAAATLNASLNRLPEDLKAKYQRLAIFPDDTAIPLTTIERWWEATPTQTQRSVERLWKASLLQDYATQTIRLHDVIRFYLRETNQSDLKQWNEEFLERYNVKQWHELPLSEGYLWRWLGYHLREANHLSVLRNMLLDPRYLQTKLDITDTNALIADCDELSDNSAILLIRSAINLSTHILDQDKRALTHQLIGRLIGHCQTRDDIKHLVSNLQASSLGLYPIQLDWEYPTHTTAGGALLRTLSGHTETVYSALELRDGRLLSWDINKTLRLWSTEGEALKVLEGHTEAVYGARELRNGRLLSWGRDKTLRLWSTEGEALKVLEGHTQSVYSVRELRDGRLLSLGGYDFSRRKSDKTVRLWSAEGGALKVLEDHTDTISGVLELRDGRLLSWSSDKTVRLWSTEGKALKVLEGHTDAISGALELSDGRLLSWAGHNFSTEKSDKTLRLWSTEGEALKMLEGHTDAISGVLELRDGRLLSWGRDKTVRLWSAEGEALKVLKGHTDTISGVLELRDGRLLSWEGEIFGTEEGNKTLRLWSAEGKALKVLKGHTGAISGVLELRDGRLLSRGEHRVGSDTTVRLWSAEGEALKVLEDTISGVLELRDGRLLSWSSDKTLRLWSTEGKALKVLEGHTEAVYGARELRNGRLLSWGRDKTLRLWGAEGEALDSLQKHEGLVYRFLILRDGRLLSWGRDKTMRLWSVEGKALKVLKGHTDTISGVLELRDGRLLSWAGHDFLIRKSDKTMRLWSAEGEALKVLEGHTDAISGVLELRDGRLLSWEGDIYSTEEGSKTLRLWSAEGEALKVLEGHTESAYAALELQDSRLLSWSNDKTLRLWSAEGEALKVLEGHTESVYSVRELRDGRLLSWAGHNFSTGKSDKTLRLWSAKGGALKVLEGHTDTISGVLELRDGRLLSWSDDEALRLWSAKGKALKVLEGHTDTISGVLELRDGRLLSWEGEIFGTEEGNKTLRLWSAEGKALKVLKGHTGAISGVLELRDGRFLSWSSDKTVRLWSAEGEALKVLKGHTDTISGVLELRDGHVLSWSVDATLRLWFYNTNLDAIVFYGDAPINCCVLLKNNVVAVGDQQGRVLFLGYRL